MTIETTQQIWYCSVCGYIHRGEAAPGVCPVCGAPTSVFEGREEVVTETISAPSCFNWRCLVCNYEEKGDKPPAVCPVCGAPEKRFEALASCDESTADTNGEALKILILGGGVAGISAAEAIRENSNNAQVTLITREQEIPYYRLNLTRLLAGEVKEEQLFIHDQNWYETKNIQLQMGQDVAGIQLTDKTVSLKNGEKQTFDRLIMATGAHPFVPPIVGANKAGVHVLRLLDDARTLQEQVKLAKSVVIIGGGVLGLECAAGMTGDGRKVTVLEGFDWLMPRQLNRQGAAQLEKFLGTLGIDVMTGVSVKELLGDEHVAGIGFADGSEIAADLVVLSTGVRPNSYLARLAGLQVDKGVLVNDLMETSHSHVYAAGDIAEHRGVLYGLWNAAQYQGTIAGLNAIGKRTEFAGIPRSNSLKVLGVDLLSIGKFEKTDGSELLIEGSNDNHYSLFLFRDSTLIGCILFGDTSIGGQVKKAIESKRNLSSLLKKNPTNIEVFDYLSK